MKDERRERESPARLTVTGNNEKLVIIAHIMHHNVRVCGYDLLFGCQLGTLLELKITNGS